MSKKFNPTFFLRVACVAALVFVVMFALKVNAQSHVPTIFISAVNRNQTVTINGSNFPTNQAFTVRMGPYGGYGINGAVSATTVNSGSGSFTAEVSIPAGVKDYGVIAIRLDGGIYSSYNWFYNNSTGVAAAPDQGQDNRNVLGNEAGRQPAIAYVGIPSLTFEKVEGELVTVRTGNFPPNQTFFVSMGSHGSAGTGPHVGTITSGDGADTSHTFQIPSSIAHYGYILVRAQTGHANPYFATVGFHNPSGPVASPIQNPPNSSPPPQLDTAQVLWLGNPTLTACAVTAGQTVTVVANNLPTNLDYTVRMNAFGTLGLNGEVVGTLSPGNNARKEQAFPIPASLAGHSKIAIRVDAGVYHAYEFFYNNTATVC